jgi:phytanoyl-CoA hydroxylase
LNKPQTNGLTKQEEEQYWKEGFLVFDNLLSSQEVEELREACEDPNVTGKRSQKDFETITVHLLGLTLQHPAFMRLAKHPSLVAKIIPLLGNDIQLQHSKLATKPPTKGLGAFPWHQDLPYYPHTNTDLLSIMVMLDDATPENGCMQMVKGSHKLGYLNHSVDQYFTGACQEPQYWEDSSLIVNIMPKAGGISIHHGLTLHGSPTNNSGKARRGIVFSYRADDAYQLADSIFDDTGVLISGEYKYIVRCEPIKMPLPRRHSKEKPFGTAWNQMGTDANKR